MYRLEGLKVFVQQRLTAAVDEIFGHFEKTITEYDEELSRRHRRLLDVGSKAEHEPRTTDAQQLMASQEEQQEWSSSLDQEDPEPPHIKEEQEDLRTRQEGEQLQPPQDTDVIKFTFVPVQREYDDEVEEEEEEEERSSLPQGAGSSSEQVKTEQDDYGEAEPAANVDPDGYLHPGSDEEAWSESRDPLSGLKALNNKIADTFLVCEQRCNDVTKSFCNITKSFICSHCRKSFERRETLNRHMLCHTGEKPYSCSVCKRHFRWRGDFVAHARTHTGEKPFMCSDCGKSFIKHGTLTRHMRIHTGERPHVCADCGRGFHRKEDLTKHVRTHTGEKPFSCNVCNRSFSRLFRLKNHKCVVESGCDE